MPLTTSQTDSDEVKCFSMCRVVGMAVAAADPVSLVSFQSARACARSRLAGLVADGSGICDRGGVDRAPLAALLAVIMMPAEVFVWNES
jgi:hypothetical protein